MLLAWLVFYTALQIARPRIQPFLSRLSSARLLISLDTVSLSVSTTTLNEAPRRLLDLLSRIRSTRTRRTSGKRRLSWLYDTGALLSLTGLVVAQVVLLWAAWRAIESAAQVPLPGDHAETLSPRLLKRAPVSLEEVPVAPSPTQGLIIRPVIPGLTTSLSGLPIFFGSLLVAQSFHELGHGLAAAAEHIPLLSTGFRLFLLFFPTFHVEVALDADVSPLTDLRVASAGVWHNVLLASVAWTWSDAGAGLADRIGRTLGLWDMLDEGVIVIAVDSHSPLAPHLAPAC
ncbi:hypothetical protein NBRC10513_005972 [Rhodotorula toruloides]|uniref:Endopeptidase S2P n=1 Tax=Rhodotorula toruloides TaxID=5286 RepID=A0A2T0A263_RHOTO|nr:hypothetical protein AAT19DRAFT_9412 [Rhodotorula toruloides]